MKRSLLILIGGLMLGAAGFAGTYVLTTVPQRSMEKAPRPELAWLRQEYQLSDAQYAKVCELHAAYHPQCMALCCQIDGKNVRLKQLLTATNAVTPEIRQALAETAQLRAQCEAAMLNHFYAVSQVMPPEQGRRYLAWMQREILVPSPMTTDQAKIHRAIP